MRQIKFETTAYTDVQYWLNKNTKILKKISTLLEECTRTPFEGTGKPEPLKYEYKTCWSRRIDHEHRLIYNVTDTEIIVISCREQY